VLFSAIPTASLKHPDGHKCSVESDVWTTIGRLDMGKAFDVFLSHNSQDKLWVIALKDILVRYGIKVWLDQDEIRPGNLFVTALERGIVESKAVALIISPESMRSGWVIEEYHRALNLALDGDLQLIPVVYKNADIPGFLQNRNWIDFRDETKYETNIRKLIWGITGEKLLDDVDGQTAVFPSTTKLQTYLETLRQILNSLKNMLSITGDLYEDQCHVILKSIEQLDDNIRIPPNYEGSTTIISLKTQITGLKNILIDFSKTCPPGDSKLRIDLIDQMDTIKKTLSQLTAKSLYL
jgi:hypothetical protein